MRESEQTVWDLEEQYWVYVEKADIEGYRTLWDESFVGWPSFSTSPVGRESIGNWIDQVHSDPSLTFDYQLRKMAVRAFGDVVVTHYQVSNTWTSKEGQIARKMSARITHTWKKKGDTWVIISGMSALEPDQE
jgi:ketosteroid isomerase-like protein